jgi:hypothetical protein
MNEIFYLSDKYIILMIQYIHPSRQNILFVPRISYITFVAQVLAIEIYKSVPIIFQYNVLNYNEHLT